MHGGLRAALIAVLVIAVANCGGGDESPKVGGTLGAGVDTTVGEVPQSEGEWRDTPGKVQIHNFLVDDGQEVAVDLYWIGTELVDDYIEVEHAEKFATLAYGESTDVLPARYFATSDEDAEEALYYAVPEGTEVAEEARTPGVLGGDEPFLRSDVYNAHSEKTTEYLNDGGTVVVFLSPNTHGDTAAQPRVQSFYAELYPNGEVNFPPPESEIPTAGSDEVVLPSGFLFGTEVRNSNGGPYADLMEWRFAADGACLPEEGDHSYGGDGADWLWVVPESASITIHPVFHSETDIECGNEAVGDPGALDGIEQPFALVVPTESGEPRLAIIDIP